MSESTPTPKPTPRPIPRPRPAAPAAAAATPAPAPLDQAAAAQAAAWGRVDSEGNVWLRSDSGERIVGQYAVGGSTEDALSLYVRRYLDLAAQITLLESRMDNISPEEATSSLKALDEQLVEPAVVGDVEALRTRISSLKERATARAAEAAAKREEAKAQAIAERTALIERAEEIANTDPSKIHWRNSRDELGQIFEQWKSAQKGGPRIDRPTEEGLWQRYSKARSQFDRLRRQHFSALESERSEVVTRKNALIAQAEALSDSTDWNTTAAQFRALMDDWRQAGHAARKEDDKLWSVSAPRNRSSSMLVRPTMPHATKSSMRIFRPSLLSLTRRRLFFPSRILKPRALPCTISKTGGKPSVWCRVRISAVPKAVYAKSKMLFEMQRPRSGVGAIRKRSSVPMAWRLSLST